MTARIGVLGAKGFIGRAACEALRRRGAEAVLIGAPRINTTARSVAELAAERRPEIEDVLAEQFAGLDAVIVAAGIADSGASASDSLFGANALLPILVARAACTRGNSARVVHVSSAAVQGRRQVLDETPVVAPFSPYSASKALAEASLSAFVNVVIMRPTSVQGAERKVTRKLVALLRSPLATVAGDGGAPTPQVLVENVGDAIAFLATTGSPPRVVLQPNEQLTVAELARVLGGHEPIRLPTPVCRAVVTSLMWCGRRSSRLSGAGRRLEMLWFGQDQAPSWLEETTWEPVLGREGWSRLA